MNRTSIEWVQNPDGTQGYTWNPITGCLNGCSYCYARRLAQTRLKDRYSQPKGIPAPANHIVNWQDPFYPRFWPDKLGEPYNRWLKRSCKPAGIFVCDMSDLFGIGIPEKWTRDVLDTIKLCPDDRFYLLTKQPQNLVKFSPFPDNCWVGVSATSQPMLTVATDHLNRVKAKLKFLSIEPLLSDPGDVDTLWQEFYLGDIGWVIIGAQTKPAVMPEKRWVDRIMEASRIKHQPVFLKNSLRPLYGDDLRQEMPQ